jgi:hypothetical protein
MAEVRHPGVVQVASPGWSAAALLRVGRFARSWALVRAGLVLLALLILASSPAQARKACLGKGERLHRVADVYLTDERRRELYLARKITIWCFLLPFNQRDDGFVLGVVDEHSAYYPLPPQPELKRLQQTGMLPNPLPAWEQDFLSIAIEGYAMWTIMLPATLFLAWRARKNANARRSAA